MVLWGSLNQLLILFIAFAAFYYKRDRAGAAFVLLWFLGDFIDVSIYMEDGRLLKLSLILGMGIKAHDWLNLFNHFDLWAWTKCYRVWFFVWFGRALFWYGPGYAKVREAPIKGNEVDD
jgi:hypothetical protein